MRFLSLAAILALGAPVHAASVLKPVSVTVVSGGTSYGNANNLIDGSGLSAKPVNGQDYLDYVGSTPTHGFSAATAWRSSPDVNEAVLKFDFGQEVSIEGFSLWLDPNSSLTSVFYGMYNIPSYPDYLNIGGATTLHYSGDGSLRYSWGQPIASPFVTSHQTLTSRYFGIRLTGCNGAQALTDGCGLGEIVFRSNLPVVAGAVPEPAAWLTMILGFGAIGAAMRRKQGKRREGSLALASARV